MQICFIHWIRPCRKGSFLIKPKKPHLSHPATYSFPQSSLPYKDKEELKVARAFWWQERPLQALSWPWCSTWFPARVYGICHFLCCPPQFVAPWGKSNYNSHECQEEIILPNLFRNIWVLMFSCPWLWKVEEDVKRSGWWWVQYESVLNFGVGSPTSFKPSILFTTHSFRQGCH